MQALSYIKTMIDTSRSNYLVNHRVILPYKPIDRYIRYTIQQKFTIFCINSNLELYFSQAVKVIFTILTSTSKIYGL